MSQRELLKRALEAIDDLERRLEDSEGRAREPLAVVGMSCRFPGADDPDALWRLLVEGVDAIRPFPRERWLDLVGAAPTTEELPWGGFIDGIDEFDPAFFGISPREATTLDPQQRLVLEGVWLALEDAAILPASLMGSSTGVFVGITTSDYGQLTRGVADDVYLATGAALNAASGRVSYVLGLQGPCMAIDTACSSSLVALHAACQSLRAGDCDLALVAGVNALLSTDAFELFTRWGMLAPDGRCKTFDAAADGFTRGEGCGVLVLQRLSEARAAGHRVLAVVRGSAVNQDGASSGLSVPNGPAQAKVLRRALQVAGVAPSEVDYVEAHGTGTVLGDPIEVEALGAVYGENRPGDRPLRIGSIKTNVGHLESASGVAGICKVILCLQRESIPPHLHFREPNPRIPWEELPIEVPVTQTPWPRTNGPRRAGVSSFGFTGTNAHIILEEAAPPESYRGLSVPACVVPVSGRTTSALRANATRYSDALAGAEGHTVADFGRAAGAGRTHFARRAAVVAASPAEAAAGLSRVAEREAEELLSATPRIAFLFSGQGAQRPGMGRELYDAAPVFRDALDRCARICDGRTAVPLLDALFAPAPEVLRNTALTQPALFALEYALSELWASWGIRPSAVLGHSLGEYVAACVAGSLEVDEALALVVDRGELMAELPPGGAMAAVFAGAEAVRPLLAGREDSVSIAAVNGPDGVVLSGRGEAVARVCEELAAEGIESRGLEVSHAFHSPLVEPILDRLEDLAGRVTPRSPQTPLAANVDGRVLGDGRLLDATYWRRQAREAVQFGRAVEAVRALGCETFLEIGPASTLLSMARRVLGNEEVDLIPSLGPEGEWRTLMSAVGRLYERGAGIDWDALTRPYATRGASLPGYAFDRRRFWVDATRRASVRGAGQGGHPLLGRPVEVAADDLRLWNGEVSLELLPYLEDHQVQGSSIVPATAYLEMALAAGTEVLGGRPIRLTDIENEKPLILGAEHRYVVQTRLSREAGEHWRFEIFSRRATEPDAPWTRHVRGYLSECPPAASETSLDTEQVRARCPEHVEGEAFYQRLAEKGNQWGPAFQSMAEVWRGDGEALARVRATEPILERLSQYRFHPALADAAGHVLVATGALERSESATGGALVGGGMGEVRLYRPSPGTDLWSHAVATSVEGPDNVVTGDVRVYDDLGVLVSETLAARLYFLQEGALGHHADSLFYRVDWRPPDLESTAFSTDRPTRWCLLADELGVVDALADLLGEDGTPVAVVRPDASGDRPSDDDQLESWEAALNGASGAGEMVGVVCLASLAGDPTDEDGGAWGALVRRDLRVAQGVIRSLASGGARGRIWFVTRGAQSIDEGAADPRGAALWGFARAIGEEHRELFGALVDLDVGAGPDACARALAEVLDRSGRERAWAVRGDAWYVPRLVEAEVAPLAAPREATGGTCLITGGLGGIGLEVAVRLVEEGCRSLVLLGRSTPPSEAGDDRWRHVRSVLDGLRDEGASVKVASVDVSDRGQVEALERELDAEGIAPVGSIYHAAGVLRYGSAVDTTGDQLAAVLEPKVDGALHLMEVFGDRRPRVIFFSSNSAILPSPLMAGYAAANAFLDAYAHRLRAGGVLATAIDWGTWGEAGMATRFTERDAGNVLTALRTLSTHEALDALDRVLEADLTQIAVMRMDWTEWARLYPHFTADPYFADLVETRADRADAGVGISREALQALGPEERRPTLVAYLAERVGAILGLAAADLDVAVGVNHLGFDSLMALEARNRIQSDLGLSIPMVRLLDGPTIDQLTDDLLIRMDAAELTSPIGAETAAGETESFEF